VKANRLPTIGGGEDNRLHANDVTPPTALSKGVPLSGIGVITNPLSRKNQRNPGIVGQLGYVLGEKGDLQQPGDLDALDEVAARFHERGIDILCVNGGDGTIHKALTALKGVYGDAPLPQVALLPGGTMNIIANSVGARGKPADVLHHVVRAYHADQPLRTTPRSLLKITSEGLDTQYGFLFGNGIIAGFLEAYYEGGQPTPAKAARVLAHGVMSTMVNGKYVKRLLKPFRGTLTLDGKDWPEKEWTAVAVGTVEQLGLGFSPFRHVIGNPGQMHVNGIGGSVIDLMWELPRTYRGAPLARPGNHDGACRELVLQSETSQSFMIDGDFHRGDREVTLAIADTIDFILTN